MENDYNACRAGMAMPVSAHDCAGVATLGAAGVEPAGLSQPNKDEGPTVATVGLQGVAQSVSYQSISSDVRCKTLATVAARLALRGYELHQLADGSLSVSRWNLSRPLADLDDVDQFLLQIGGPA